MKATSSTLSFRRFFQLLVVSLFIASAAVATQAYTLVMRDGRRVQIPDAFVVTNSTLTYQVAADIQVTVQLTSVDIPATHRLNSDQRLLPRTDSVKPPAAQTPTVTQRRSSRTITNDDLESYRKNRVENEVAYEQRRKELGLPTLVEQKRALNEITERAREQAIKTQSSEAQSESYWRQRASELRAEINATDARIQSVRQFLDQTPSGYSFGAFTTVLPTTVGLPFGPTNIPVHRYSRPGVFSPPAYGSSLNVRVGVPLGRQGRLFVNARSYENRGYFNRYGNGAVLAIPFQQYDYNFDRTSLVNQLNELSAYRGGLQSRWRDLEEEARRAGAYPGWLRQ